MAIILLIVKFELSVSQSMKNKLFCLCLLLFSTAIFAQEFELTGFVISLEEEPIVFANVVLMHSKDSTILKGASTDTLGKFVFSNLAKGKYLLRASYIESVSKVVPVDVFADTNIGSLMIVESSQQLDEVTVALEKPTIEQKVDRLVFNVENTALADGTIWELLKQTPNVNVVDNQLTIKGSANIGVLINGRKVTIPQSDIINLLSGSSASNVEAIEVITSPPLKYGAEGGMLINIKMKKNLIAGYIGSLFNYYTVGVFAKNMTGTDHFFKGKKTNFSTNYSFSFSKNFSRFTDITNFSEGGNPTSKWNSVQDIIGRRKRHNLSAFFDYNLDKKNTLSISTINVFSPVVDRLSFNKTKIDVIDDDLPSSFFTNNDTDKEQLNVSFYADWVHRLKKKGAELSFGGHYTMYDSKSGQDIQTSFFDENENSIGENDFSTQADQKVKLYSFKSDFSSPITKSTRLEAGLRYAGINSESNISQVGFDRNQPGINPTEQGIFSYDEAIYAAYTSFSSSWNLWNLKAGIRVEQTETKGELDTENSTTENSYFNVFPSVSLQYKPSKKHQYKFTYYKRIERPRYSSINPFQNFESNFSVTQGNQGLLPTIKDWVSLEYTYDRDYTLAVYYLKNTNALRVLTFQDNESNLLRFLNANIEENSGYGFDFTINKNILRFWNSYLFISYFYNQDRYIDLDSGQLLTNELWSGFVRFNNNFRFLEDKSLTASLSFAYYSPKVFGNARRDSYNKLNIRFRKTFLEKNLSVSIGVEDIFNQNDRFTSRSYLNQNNSTLTQYENRLFTLDFRYRFGNTRIKGNKKSKNLEERKRL